MGEDLFFGFLVTLVVILLAFALKMLANKTQAVTL